MEPLLNRILKKLVDNQGAVILDQLFDDIHSVKNKDTFQKLLDYGYAECSFIDPSQSCDMIVELTMTGYDAYVKENIKC